MSKYLKYSVGGKPVTRLEAIAYYTKQAENYAEPEKSAFLEMISQEFQNDRKMEKSRSVWETWVQGGVGIILLLFSVYMAFLVPNPTRYQSGVLWVLVAMAAALSIVLVTGSIEITNKWGIKAAGGCAIFVMMFFYVPKIYDKTSHEQSKINLYVAISTTSKMQKISADFNPSSTEKMTVVVRKCFDQYTGQPGDDSSYISYRKSDGKIYSTEICSQEQEHYILMISAALAGTFPGKRQAYLHYKPIADSL